ncbi:MAG TPA: transglycosylase SLT domain-containing protein [Cellvibrio sp.]|nr:transglycosylase SLT domain-containing protein [Cellvibrio sp.]
MKLVFLLFCSVFLFAGCASVPPSNPNNICDIFEDKPGWYKDAKKSEEKWGSTVPVMMSIMYQESQFVQKARTKRTKILWIFPGPRLSNAYGFAQVKTETWGDYVRDQGGMWARRDNFGDAVDFIGWYNTQSQKRSKIQQNDAYNLYLAYHEGHGGFNRKTYNSKAWLKSTAQKVATRSAQYTKQLQACEDDLQSSGWWPF